MRSSSLKILITAVFMLGLLMPVSAQSVKDEVERSIDRGEMPAKAVDLIDEFWPDLKDINYFHETDGLLTTYEAKLKWRGNLYSIEFNIEGAVLDVEKLIKFDAIPETARNGITHNLESQFNSYRLTRIQQQFLARDEDDEDDEDDADFIDDILEEDAEDYEIRYEIEVDGQNKEELGSFELLYNDSGSLIEKRRIMRRSLDNIW